MPLARPRGLCCRAAAELAAVALLLLLLLLPASSASSAPSARNASDEIEASSTTTAALARPPLSSSAPPPPLSSPAPPPRRRRPRPVVLWHGMGDSCCAPQSMGALAAEIGRELPGTRVLSLDTSFGGGDDVMSGFFGDVRRRWRARATGCGPTRRFGTRRTASSTRSGSPRAGCSCGRSCSAAATATTRLPPLPLPLPRGPAPSSRWAPRTRASRPSPRATLRRLSKGGQGRRCCCCCCC